MKWLKNNKGSTLLLVVITVAILSMLGTALLAMSLMNINMKHNDNRIKKTLYYAESGIDQVYARVGKLVETSIDAAIAQTDIDMKVILGEIDAMLLIGPPTGAEASTLSTSVTFPILLSSLVTSDGSGNYVLNTVNIQRISEEKYRDNFRIAMNANADQAKVINQLSLISYVNLESVQSNIVIDTSGINVRLFTNTNGSVYAVRGIKSTFTYENHTEKAITTDIVVTDNIKSYPLNTVEKRTIIPDNPIWQKALVSNDDINFNSNATINGDIYGYGKIPTGLAINDPKNFGGVIVDGSSSVTVNGNIYSRSYVQLAPTSSSSARLIVNNGLIYANSMVLQSGSQGKMIVNGSVYTFDDLELNGTGGEISINGSYYGYTDGSSTGLSHDKSSAIVINADMEAGSRLAIDGTYNSVASAQKPTIDYLETNEGILIGGTAYVDVQPTRYQTAESVSVRGNFVAYTWGFDQDTVNLMKTAGDNIFNKSPYNFYSPSSSATYDTKVEAKLLKDNVDWLGIASSTVTLANGSSSSEYELKDRKAYFIAFKKYVDGDSNTFIKGGNIAPGSRSINLQNFIYTTGLKLVYDSTSNENEYLDLSYKSGSNANQVGQSEFNTLSGKILDDHIYQLQMMKYRNGVVGMDPAADLAAPSVVVAPTYYNVNAIEKFTKIDTMTTGLPHNPALTVVPSVRDVSLSANEVTYVNNATGSTLHIYAPGATVPSPLPASNIVLTLNRAQGVIVHNGDIVIHGSLDFTGAIISNGTISTSGGTQEFYNNTTAIRNYLAKKIYEDNILFDLFNVIDRGGPGTPNVSLSKIQFVEFDKNKTLDPNNNSKYNYSDLMNFEHWKVEK